MTTLFQTSGLLVDAKGREWCWTDGDEVTPLESDAACDEADVHDLPSGETWHAKVRREG